MDEDQARNRLFRVFMHCRASPKPLGAGGSAPHCPDATGLLLCFRSRQFYRTLIGAAPIQGFGPGRGVRVSFHRRPASGVSSSCNDSEGPGRALRWRQGRGRHRAGMMVSNSSQVTAGKPPPRRRLAGVTRHGGPGTARAA